MPILQTISYKCGQCLSNKAWQLLKRHFGYLLDYKKNLKNLEDEKTELENQQAKINEKVEEATIRGEEISNVILNWLARADSVTRNLVEFMNEKTRKENIQCWCLNFKGRYQLSKQAQEMKVNVKRFTNEGTFDLISRRKLFPIDIPFSPIKGYPEFESRDLVFRRIVDALTDSEVKIVGVYGQGGVGKTTIVQVVGIHVKENDLFDEVVVAVVSRPQNVKDIQQQIAHGLNPKLELGSNEKERAVQLMNRLNNGKRNLIILDDIWEELENLNVIGIPITDGNKGCKLVLTSRDRDNWKNMRREVSCRDFQIDLLSDSEAWDLFKKKVGNSVGDELICPVAQKVCQECGRLPVAIIKVGEALQDRDLNAWKYVLDQLENSMLMHIDGIDLKLYDSLKLSFDLLQSKDAKSIFLLCCLFPEDANISIDEDLTRHCMARRLLDQQTDTLEEARVAVRTVVGTLKTSCLLLEGKDKNFVKMHVVIRDVAVSIYKLELHKPILVEDGVQDWPEEGMCKDYSAIVLHDACINELPDELVYPQLHTLRLRHQYGKGLLKVPDNFLSAVENLTILDLSRICLSSSLAKLVNLRMLCLYSCKLEDVSILKDLKKSLEILILGSDTDDGMTALLQEVGQLIRLRLLDLRYCKDLKAIPRGVISNLTDLEELYIPDSCDQWEGTTPDVERSNASLVELSSLTRLTSLHIHITNVATLPKNFRFEKLIRFRISVGKKFKYHEGTDIWTRILKLSGITLEDDQFSVLLDTKLLDIAEVVYLEKLQGLKKVIHNRGGVRFLNVKYLAVKKCDDLEYLFSSFCASEPLQLQHLEIKDCQMIEKIVGIFEEEKDEEELTNKVVNFSHLKYMMLEKLPNLISFYPRMKKIATPEGHFSTHSQPLFNEKFAFPVLEELAILNVPNITCMWDHKLLSAEESFCQLKDVRVENCYRLENLFIYSMLSRLQNLEEVTIKDCPEMEVIVSKNREKEVTNFENIVVFPQLKILNLKNLKGICAAIFEAKPFKHKVTFPKLTRLSVINCGNSGEIHLSPQGLQNLHKLTVRNCDWLKEMDFGGEEGQHIDLLTNTTNKIKVMNLPKLTVRNYYQLNEVLFMWEGPHVDVLINTNKVKVILLDKLPRLTSLWSKDPRTGILLGNLEVLFIGNCPHLRNLFTSSVAMALERLERLFLTSCTYMEEVIDATNQEGDKAQEIVFPNLKVIVLIDMPSLEGFCSTTTANYNLNLQSLEFVFIRRCYKMKTFALGQIRMPPQITSLPNFDSDDDDDEEGIPIEDLNNYVVYLQNRFLEGEDEEDYNDFINKAIQRIECYPDQPRLRRGMSSLDI